MLLLELKYVEAFIFTPFITHNTKLLQGVESSLSFFVTVPFPYSFINEGLNVFLLYNTSNLVVEAKIVIYLQD